MNSRFTHTPALPRLGLGLLLFATWASQAFAALPTEPAAVKEERSTHIVSGKVVGVYESRDTLQPGQVMVNAVAEIDVAEVRKGEDIRASDRIFVRYWYRTWLPDATPMPGNDGNRNIPKDSDNVVLYLVGDRRSGFTVTVPDGFEPIQ